MNETGLTEQLAFVVAQRQQDEATVLAQAVREGIQLLYQEVLIEAYLLGRVPREMVLKELGLERLEEIEYQRDALQRDVEWGEENEELYPKFATSLRRSLEQAHSGKGIDLKTFKVGHRREVYK